MPGVQSQTPSPWFTETPAKRRGRGTTEQMLLRFLFLRCSALSSWLNTSAQRKRSADVDRGGLCFCPSEGITFFFIQHLIFLNQLSLIYFSFPVLSTNVCCLTGKTKKMIEYPEGFRFRANTVQVVCLPLHSPAKQFRQPLFAKKYHLSPAWQHADFRMVDWSCSVAMPFYSHLKTESFPFSSTVNGTVCSRLFLIQADTQHKSIRRPVKGAII